MMKEIELQTDVDFCMNLSRIILVIVLDTYLHIQQIANPKRYTTLCDLHVQRILTLIK